MAARGEEAPDIIGVKNSRDWANISDEMRGGGRGRERGGGGGKSEIAADVVVVVVFTYYTPGPFKEYTTQHGAPPRLW